jgi:GT2 family glycosyltransferase
MIDIAVVILNWNGEKLLEKFLPSFIDYTKREDTKIFVADNASSDNSINFIKQNYPQIELVVNDKNYGFAEGYNQALKKIEAKYYVIINSDVEVTEGWIDGLYNTIKSDENIAAVQPKIKSHKQKTHFEYAGAAGGMIDRYGYTFCRGRIFNIFEEDKNQYEEETKIFWASGACIFIKANLFHELGGFDADFFAHMEEIDLCWRLKNRGYDIVYTPKSTVYHIGGATLDESSPFKTYLNFRNNLYLLYKNLSDSYFHRIFVSRLLLDGVAGLKFLFGFEFKNFSAVIKAHLSFYANAKSFKSKRYENKKHNVNYKHKEIYNRSIVYDFFVKGVKEYKDLIGK